MIYSRRDVLKTILLAVGVSLMSLPAWAGDAVITFEPSGTMHVVGTVESVSDERGLDGALGIVLSTPDKESFIAISAAGGLMSPALGKLLAEKIEKHKNGIKINLNNIKSGEKIEFDGLYENYTTVDKDKNVNNFVIKYEDLVYLADASSDKKEINP